MKELKVKDKNEIIILEKIGSGAYSECFKIDDNNVVKIFRIKDRRGYSFSCTKESLETLEKLNTSTLNKANAIIYDENDNIIAIVTKFIKGNNLEIMLDGNIKLNVLLEQYKQVIKDLKILAHNRIITSDICSQNIIYNNGFHIIETDEYYKNENYSENRCFKESKLYFDKSIVKSILKKDDDIYLKFEEYINSDNFDFEYFINLFIDKISTIDELRNISINKKIY